MKSDKRIFQCLSPQVSEMVNRICDSNFGNPFPYREWKGYFNTCVQWLRLFQNAIFEIGRNTETVREDTLLKAQLLGGELGSCHYRISSLGNRTIIYVIDISFNEFQFQGFKLILNESDYQSSYKSRLQTKDSFTAQFKRAPLRDMHIRTLKSGYRLVKFKRHVAFLKPNKKELLFNKWFITATDFDEHGKAYAQGSDNNIYEIDTDGNMRLSDKSLGDINNLLESRRAIKSLNERMTNQNKRHAIPLYEVMRLLAEEKHGNLGWKGSQPVFNKLERELKAHEKETGIKVSRHPRGATQFSVKNPEGGEMIFYGDKDPFIAEVVKGLEKYGKLREMRTFELGGKTYRQFRKCSDK